MSWLKPKPPRAKSALGNRQVGAPISRCVISSDIHGRAHRGRSGWLASWDLAAVTLQTRVFWRPLMPRLRGRGAGRGGLDGCGAVEQWLAAQPLGDVAGFADRGHGCLRIVELAEAMGVVEQPVGQVVGGGVLAQAGDRGGERRGGAWIAIKSG